MNQEIKSYGLNLGVILILISIIFYLLFLSLYSYIEKELDVEWLKEGSSMMVIILAELGAVAILLEERLRQHFNRQFENIRKILEIERREGRKYTIGEKEMILEYDNQTNILKFTEINTFQFEREEDAKEFYYPIYYDIKHAITNHNITLRGSKIPRVAAYRIEKHHKRRLELCDLAINGNILTAFLNPKLTEESNKIIIERNYHICDLDRYFTRMIQDPVYTIKIRITEQTLKHILNVHTYDKEKILNKIKIKDYELREADKLFDFDVEKGQNNEVIITITPKQNKRPRFYIMDRIQIEIPGVLTCRTSPQATQTQP